MSLDHTFHKGHFGKNICTVIKISNLIQVSNIISSVGSKDCMGTEREDGLKVSRKNFE
jgi:hypothetical protein